MCAFLWGAFRLLTSRCHGCDENNCCLTVSNGKELKIERDELQTRKVIIDRHQIWFVYISYSCILDNLSPPHCKGISNIHSN